MSRSTRTLPGTLKFGAIISLIQVAVAFSFAIYFIIKDLTSGVTESVESSAAAANWIGIGTALYIFLLFGTVCAGAVSLLLGRTWGRTPLVMMDALLIPVAVYMAMEGLWAPAVAVGLAAVLSLGGVLHPQSTAWVAENYRI